MIIGLTGGTGTGKTSISEIFSDKGFRVINYDLVSRQIYQKDSDIIEHIVINDIENINLVIKYGPYEKEEYIKLFLNFLIDKEG